LSINVTDSEILTEDNPLQRLKAYKPMDVTEFGIVTEVNPLQP